MTDNTSDTGATEFGSFADRLSRWARERGESLALCDAEVRLTWAEAGDRIERIAAALQGAGLQPGQAVALLGRSSVAYALVFLAAIRAGGCAAPLTSGASADQLDAMLRDSGAAILFVDRARLQELGERHLRAKVRVILDDELDAFMAPKGTNALPFAPGEDDPFNIIYSSGTTGTPKGIVHSHAMRWRQMAMCAALGFDADTRALTSTPLYSNTTMVAFLPTLFMGGCVHIMGKFDAAEWLHIAEREAITHTMLVPVQYQRLLAQPELDRADLSAMKVKTCTSAPFSPELKREVLRRMPGGLIEIYGMTEGGVTCLLPVHAFPGKLHTVGRPAPGHAIKVLGENGQEVPPGESGELVGRSSATMLGYKGQPELTRASFWSDPGDGTSWMRTGDIGRVDAEGFVELVGRTKDLIISGGFNIYPADLEAELERDPRVIEAAVIGVPSQTWGETPLGFVVLAQGAGEDCLAAILDAANARLGKTQRMSALRAIAELPRSHIGKVLKTELRDMARDGAAA